MDVYIFWSLLWGYFRKPCHKHVYKKPASTLSQFVNFCPLNELPIEYDYTLT